MDIKATLRAQPIETPSWAHAGADVVLELPGDALCLPAPSSSANG